MSRRSLRCEPLAGGGFGRSAGPLTDRDRETVAAFAELLHAAWLTDHPDEIELASDEPGLPATVDNVSCN